jgi:hypothetical protein
MANSCVSSGMLQLGVGEHELAQIRVEREAIDAVAHGQHQHGGGAIQGITGGHLFATRAGRSRPRPHRARSRSPSCGARSTLKMLPTDTFTSMLLEPSSGSNTIR